MILSNISAISIAVTTCLIVQAVSQNASPGTSYGPPGGSFTPGQPLSNYNSGNSQGASSSCANTDLSANKKLVVDFYQNVFGQKQFHLVEKYIAEDMIQHNPGAVDGRESLLQLLNGPLGQGPPGKVDIKRVSAEGDLVWTHTRFPAPALNKVFAVADIFRINCAGLIQEHWDVIQDIDVKTNNPHPFF